VINSTRRTKLLEILTDSSGPRTGAELSDLLGVTRQIIVADIALLRAAGEQIIATPNGYLINNESRNTGFTCTVVSKHSADYHDIEDELFTIVDYGGCIVDVTVEHPVYGQMTGLLHIESRHDVAKFIERLSASKAEPLLVLTEGLHLHTLQAKDEETLNIIVAKLKEKGYVISA
jgi:transcriptional regulator of NAD metabolism